MTPLIASALPNDGTGYVFAGYMFFFLMLLVYLLILGAKFQRLNRELDRVNRELEADRDGKPGSTGADRV